MEAFLSRINILDMNAWSGTAVIALRITLIAAAAWIAAAVLNRAIRMFRESIARRFHEREQIKRAETLGRVFRDMVSVVISLIAGVLILSELGVSVAPILGAAGVVGLTGFFILSKPADDG